MYQGRNQGRNQWKSGTVVDCLDDVDVCMVTFCLPCLVFSENRSTLHGGPSSMHDEGIDPCVIYCLIMTLSACTLQCLYAYTTRTDIRRKYNLEEEPCDDCMTHIFCHCCALCQEHRELKKYPLTKWPMPADQNQMAVYDQQYHSQGRTHGSVHSHQQQTPFATPSDPYSSGHQRHPMSMGTGSTYSSNVPLHYGAYSSAHPQYAPTASPPPYGYAGGNFYPQTQFPAAPPQAGPPQPLVYETHRVPGPYGTGVIPGIPAHVYQVPKFPDMRREAGMHYQQNRPDDPNAHPQ